MTTHNPLWEAIITLASRNKLATTAAIERASGVARTTLMRIRDRGTGRSDALARLDQAFGVDVGTLERIERGEIALDAVLTSLDGDTHRPTPGTEFRLQSLEEAVAKMQEAMDELQSALEAQAEESDQ